MSGFDSDPDYSDNDNSERGYDTDEAEGYGDIEEDFDSEIKDSQSKRSSLESEKYNLLLTFNANGDDVIVDDQVFHGSLIDENVYKAKIREIDEALLELDERDSFITQELAEKEIEFSQILDRYVEKSKRNIKLTEEEIKKMKDIRNTISQIRENYKKQTKKFEPDNSFAGDFDMVSDPETVKPYRLMTKGELNEFENTARKNGLKAVLPKPKDFSNESDFEKAWSKYYKKVNPWVNEYVKPYNTFSEKELNIFRKTIKHYNLLIVPVDPSDWNLDDPDDLTHFKEQWKDYYLSVVPYVQGYLEANDLKNLSKQYKLGLKQPKIGNFKTKKQYEAAWSEYYRKLIPYIPGEVSRINPTRIGEVSESIKGPKNVIEMPEKVQVTITPEEDEEQQKLFDIKKSLKSIDKDKLIDCIQNSSSVNIGYSYINELRNNAVPVVKYQNVFVGGGKKVPANYKLLLLNLLRALSKKDYSNLSEKELEAVLNEKYQIPPSLYFNQNAKYKTIVRGEKGTVKTMITSYNTKSPIILVKQYPIPRDILPEGQSSIVAGVKKIIKKQDEKYYERFYPVPDPLYQKLSSFDTSEVLKIYIVPVNIKGTRILKKVVDFEDYLGYIKDFINERLIDNENILLSTKSSDTIKILSETNLILRDRIYQIDEYLTKGRILAPYRLRFPQFNMTNNILKIDSKTRNANVNNLNKAIKSTTISKEIEKGIFEKTGDIYEYKSKIENIIFMFGNYPEIKNKLLLREFTIDQLVKYDKDLMFHEYSTAGVRVYSSIQKPTIQVRRTNLSKIKNSIQIGLKSKIKYPILADIIFRKESKRIELMVFDISENLKTNEYIIIIAKLSKFLELSNFANDLVMGKITNEQLLTLIKKIKLGLNSEIIKGKPTPIPKTEDELKKMSIEEVKEYNQLVKDSMKDSAENLYRRMSIAEIDVLLSQERSLLSRLNKEKTKNINLGNNYLINLKQSKRLAQLYKDRLTSKDPESVNKAIDVIEKNMTTRKIWQNRWNPDSIILADLKRSIIYSQTNIEKLEKVKDSKYLLINKVKRLFINKYTTPKVKTKEIKAKVYQRLDKEAINQFFFAFQRQLIDNNLKTKINQNNLNIVVDILEVLAINEIYHSRKFIGDQEYNKLKKQLDAELRSTLGKNIGLLVNVNWDALTLNRINQLIGTNAANIDELYKNWPTSKPDVISGASLFENYLFDRLLSYKPGNPFTFFDDKKVRSYETLVKSKKLAPIESPKREMVIYDPLTGKFGKNSVNGYLFNVYKLEKNPNTGQPVIIHTFIKSKNPRLGISEDIEQVEFEKPGKTYFIKLPVVDPNHPEKTFVWVEVPAAEVGFYPLDYDTCRRLDLKENECNEAYGLGYDKCFYKDNKCTAGYKLNVVPPKGLYNPKIKSSEPVKLPEKTNEPFVQKPMSEDYLSLKQYIEEQNTKLIESGQQPRPAAFWKSIYMKNKIK